jgi:hypothetical protein
MEGRGPFVKVVQPRGQFLRSNEIISERGPNWRFRLPLFILNLEIRKQAKFEVIGFLVPGPPSRQESAGKQFRFETLHTQTHTLQNTCLLSSTSPSSSNFSPFPILVSSPRASPRIITRSHSILRIKKRRLWREIEISNLIRRHGVSGTPSLQLQFPLR